MSESNKVALQKFLDIYRGAAWFRKGMKQIGALPPQR
jgi:hypothetical protein